MYLNAHVEYESHKQRQRNPNQIVASQVHVRHISLPPRPNGYPCSSTISTQQWIATTKEIKWNDQRIYQSFEYVPARGSWTLRTTMQITSNGVSLYTISMTSSSVENQEGYCFAVTIRISPRKRPIRKEVITTTTAENFAALGCDAPSSFDTLTLHQHLCILSFHVSLTWFLSSIIMS